MQISDWKMYSARNMMFQVNIDQSIFWTGCICFRIGRKLVIGMCFLEFVRYISKLIFHLFFKKTSSEKKDKISFLNTLSVFRFILFWTYFSRLVRFSNLSFLWIYIYIYIYIWLCVCVCVCVWYRGDRSVLTQGIHVRELYTHS